MWRGIECKPSSRELPPLALALSLPYYCLLGKQDALSFFLGKCLFSSLPPQPTEWMIIFPSLSEQVPS